MGQLAPEVLEELRALATATESRDGWFTTRDVMEAMGLSKGQARDVLRELLKSGRLDTGRVTLGYEEGYLRRTNVPAYNLRDAARRFRAACRGRGWRCRALGLDRGAYRRCACGGSVVASAPGAGLARAAGRVAHGGAAPP